MEILYSNEILAIITYTLAFIVLFKVSKDVKYLNNKIEQIENEIKDFKINN